MIKLRPTLPHWTAHPGFGVAVLLALAVTLIIHGEPQPSSHPSGKSVVISGTSPVPIVPPPALVIRHGEVEWRSGASARRVALPSGARPRRLLTSRGVSVVLAVINKRQHAYAIDKKLAVTDLGLADGAIAAAPGTAAVIIETSADTPGALFAPEPVRSGATTSTSASSSSPVPQNEPPPLGDFLARRYDASGRALGSAFELPPGMRLATDTSVGLVVWQPASRVFDAGVAQESLSADAALMRPDGTVRSIGPVHPLAATKTDLLVWDVESHRFGLMPLQYVTSTATTTATPTKSPTKEATATTTPSTVAGVKWFERTRGFVVTGPASFAGDNSAFAVYALVGSRRRMVVAQVANIGTDQMEVLALVQPTVKPSTTDSPSGTTDPASTLSPSKTPSATIPAFEPEGFPIPAPQTPIWWSGIAVAVSGDGTVVGYRPGTAQASVLDLGVTEIDSLAQAP
jgi:hypothetical protein